MKIFNELNAYFEDLEQQELFSGVATITRGSEQLFAGGYGYANRAWQIKNTLETRFDTASITKLFTAVAVLQLIDRQKLDFNTRVIDYLGLENTAISRDVNIYHLLTHTSGIADDADEENGESYEALWQSRPNYAVTATADFLPQFAHKPANFPPGQGCRYCNCGYVLLGLLIEKASGLTYRDYVRQNIFAKCGMTRSGFFHQAEVTEQLAEGYTPIRDAEENITGWRKNIYAYPPIGSPDGGAHVTAQDLDRFLRAVKAGEVLTAAATQAFFTPQVHYLDRNGWEKKFGYGLWFYVEPDGKVVCAQKEGVNTGVSAVIRHFPAQDINVVLLCNLEDAVWKPVWKIHELIINAAW